MTLTTLSGGAPLAQTVQYPKLLHLKHSEQSASWKDSLKQAEVQVQRTYMQARAYPLDTDHQQTYIESVEALKNLREAYDEWVMSTRPA